MEKAAVPAEPSGFVQSCPAAGRIRWTHHALTRLVQRSLRRQLLLESIGSLEVIEHNVDDKYLPSYLLRGSHGALVFHVLIAADVEGNNVRVVTMYLPDPQEWSAGFRERRTAR